MVKNIFLGENIFIFFVVFISLLVLLVVYWIFSNKVKQENYTIDIDWQKIYKKAFVIFIKPAKSETKAVHLFVLIPDP